MDLLREKLRARGHHCPGVAAALIGSAVVGGAMSASASNSAANKQSAAANRATDAQTAMFDRTVQLNAPYDRTGQSAMGRLSGLLGLGTPGQIGANGQVVDPVTAAYHQYLGRDANDADAQYLRQQLANGSQSEDQIRSLIANSQEANTQHAGWQGGATTADPSFGSLLKPFGMEDFQLDPGSSFRRSRVTRP
jgi:hypothetical protein